MLIPGWPMLVSKNCSPDLKFVKSNHDTTNYGDP